MADYKRLVSYIYSYELGIRRKNVGFSRVESRNGQCKVTIHITANVSSQEPLKVYLFHREGSQLEGIHMGDMYVKNGVGDFKTETNTMSLMSSGYKLDDISGVIVFLNENKFYGSQWDDQEIRIENFFEYNMNKLNEHSDLNQKEMTSAKEEQLVKDIVVEPANITDMIMQDELASQIQEPENQEKLLAAEVSEEQSVPEDTIVINEVVEKVANAVHQTFQEKSEVKQEETTTESPEEEYTSQEVQAMEEKMDTQMEEQTDECSYEEEQAQEEVAATEYADSQESLEGAGVEDEESENIVLEASSMTNPCCCSENYPECVRNVLRSFPAVKPFPNSSLENWVRIEPKDIGMLPVETWILANNSFLLHGYYNYRHLLFGVLQINESPQYVIGVPGLLQSTEQTMAGMFGFHRFLSIQGDNNRQNNFGYWIQQIVL